MGGKLHGTPERPEEAIVLGRGSAAAEDGRLRRLRRALSWFVMSSIVNASVIAVYEWLSPELDAEHALLTGALVVLVNTYVWPLLSRLSLVITVWTFGLIGVVLNALLLTAVINVTPGVGQAWFWDVILVVFVLVVVNGLLAGVFGLRSETDWHLRAVSRQLRRRGQVQETDVPGVIFLEIDGLAAPVLRRALVNGYLPTLARWLRSGEHRLMEWECDLSSQTSASQSGLLLGSNEGIPAFRWYDRSRGTVVASGSPRDVAELEQRLSTGAGLLADGGASRVNLVSGDATHVMFTLSKVGIAGRSGARDYAAYFAQPFQVVRTFVAALQDIVLELWQSADQRRRNVWPRIHRHGTYPLLRAFTTVVQRDIAIAALMQDMVAGVPRAYATFVGYDEVAHHSGVERSDALAVLRRLDSQFARLEHARRYAARPYHFVVLSDHGQVQGATFQQRFGQTLEQFVHDVAGADVASRAATDDRSNAEERAHVAAMFGDIGSSGSGVSARVARATSERTHSDRESRVEAADLLVLASGNLANVYVADAASRLDRTQLEARMPGLVDALAAHPGVGFVLVRDADGGATVLGADGSVDLESGDVAGIDPLAPYGPNALRHLRRSNGFEHVGDILVMGTYDPRLDEACAFEQLCGSHGGLGGAQTRPFALFPAGWYEPSAPIVGAGEMHKVLKRWLADVGQDVAMPPGMDQLPPPRRVFPRADVEHAT